ncbi:alpha/beta hydrolase [Pontiella sulfatireligans]|uniref:Carboxylesterase NlhH n=1 Tax=Pontiella sulfatireligans TaxID=2750658 RepID=A0A6C2URI2_9BACT|nr:alpha/beta hydrolase [Pontiella sulfatireligans]VGO21894.1 Carboxylesterase NlhH [Pontiella sulfatireligans]
MRIFILVALCAASAFGKGTWEEQQARAEEISAEYQAMNPAVSSERFVFKTVALPDGSKLDLDMRVVRPKQGGPFPVVFFVHGGAWATGSKAQFTHESFVLADQGIAGVRMEYRWKSKGAKYPEAIGDVMDAIDFVRQRAKELNLDFTRVGLAGGSAGGHLSAIAAQLTPECICYDGYNGLFDAYERNGGKFGGGDYTGTTEAEKKKASAIYLIKTPPPDTFLYHGTADTTVVIEQAYRFAEAIRAKGGNAEVLAYEGAGHAFFNKEPYQTASTQALLDHTSYLFGLTDQRPDLSKYKLPPKANAERKDSPMNAAGFLVGDWRQEDDPGKSFTFNSDYTAVSVAGAKLKWEESDGQLFIIWKSGTLAPIKRLSANRISVGKHTYLRESTK